VGPTQTTTLGEDLGGDSFKMGQQRAEEEGWENLGSGGNHSGGTIITKMGEREQLVEQPRKGGLCLITEKGSKGPNGREGAGGMTKSE